MTALINKLLFPMDLKKYMILSFVTLWTLLLITALVVLLIQQINYQASPNQLRLEFEISNLTRTLETTSRESQAIISAQKERIIALEVEQGQRCLWDE
jgi:uncharacterized membrane protein affecting hemolysin expression